MRYGSFFKNLIKDFKASLFLYCFLYKLEAYYVVKVISPYYY